MKTDIEEGLVFTPHFDAQGLIPCITVCAQSGAVLMMAYMNAEALEKTLSSRQAHYWSRSRAALWHKGASSGAVQDVVSLSVDCDQDCLLLRVRVRAGHENETCHTGRKTCFYRSVDFKDRVLRHCETQSGEAIQKR